MKKQIVCLQCTEVLRNMFASDTPYPGDHVKFVTGAARRPFCCDSCGETIDAGADCTAHSIWAGESYYPWESQYLCLWGNGDDKQ